MPKKEKVKGRNNQTSLGTSRSNFSQSKQKKKDSVENSVENYESNINDDPNERIDLTESLETYVEVGAFAVPGIEEGMNALDETELLNSRLSMTHTSQDVSSLKITSAQVVDDVIFDATPLEGVSKKGLILSYSLVAIVSLLLQMVIIIPTILLTRQSSQVSPNVVAAKDEFLKELKTPLTNTSIQELEHPDSSQLLALDWLLKNSNFTAYSMDRTSSTFCNGSTLFLNIRSKMEE